MSEKMNDVVENLREPLAWLRLVYMLAYALALYFVLVPLVFVLMVVQALFSLFAGEQNDNLRKFGAAFSEYIHQILRFLTFNSDEKPFPFSAFPGMSLDDDIDAPAADKPARKRRASRTSRAGSGSGGSSNSRSSSRTRTARKNRPAIPDQGTTE